MVSVKMQYPYVPAGSKKNKPSDIAKKTIFKPSKIWEKTIFKPFLNQFLPFLPDFTTIYCITNDVSCIIGYGILTESTRARRLPE